MRLRVRVDDGDRRRKVVLPPDEIVRLADRLCGDERVVVIDPAWTPALNGPIAHGVRSEDPDLARDQTLFALLMGIRDTSVAEVYVRGRRVAAAEEGL